LQHPEVHNTLRKLAEITGLSGIPELPANPWGNAAPWNEAYADGRATASHFRRTVARNPRRRSLLLAVKAGLVVSDSVASGLVREEINILDWIQDVAHREPLTAEMLREHVIEPRIQKLSRKGPFQWHRFQELAAQQDSRALLLAACGTGKSMAAWRWAETQLRKHSLGKVLFLYPTRGTATEGFRDYVGWAPEDDAALLHGSSRYELEAMQHNPEEPLTQKGVRGPTEGEQRLYSLAFWPRRYFSATVDQFLGFLENSYGSLCLLPVLADSAVIIDEVHSFDRKMFDGLIAFLQAFDVPVLCMTATLAPGRREELIKAGLRVFPSEQDREQLQDLAAKEQHPRYELRTVDGSHTAFHIATQAFREGKRVLWVVNRVARCQELARLLAAELGKSPHCYHSRFRLRDRQAVHQKTIQAFQQREQAAIAVTTQVCEMSLDLDADVLISELAPPSSLVQRFGRANRHLARGDDFRAQLVVYQPDSHRPYEKSDLLAAEKFLAGLGQVVSQHQLALALEKHAAEERIADGSTAFLRGDYFAVAGEFRDSDDISERCVLDSDLRDVQDCLRAHQPYDGFLVSIPRKEPTTDPPATLPRFLRVAQKARYDDLLGYVAGEG
jgi:CRISPR-associated endonuclease/helicase Cas3